MSRTEDAQPVVRVNWLVVDKEQHVDTIKHHEGIEHHISADRFFDVLEHIAKLSPNELMKPIQWRYGEDVPHVVQSLQKMRKRRALIVDLDRLIQHWPVEWEGYPNLYVVSVSDSHLNHVPGVPEVFHFVADSVCVVRQGKTTGIRHRSGTTTFDEVVKLFPLDSRTAATLR